MPTLSDCLIRYVWFRVRERNEKVEPPLLYSRVFKTIHSLSMIVEINLVSSFGSDLVHGKRGLVKGDRVMSTLDTDQ